WYRWLKDVIAQAGSRLDLVSQHVYSTSASGVTTRLETATFFGSQPDYWDVIAPSVKEVLVATGWLGRPFWLTETGWASDRIGEAQQAQEVSTLLADWASGRADRAWLSRVFLYELRDDGRADIPKWGLLRPDATQKPSFGAWRAFVLSHA